MLEHTKNIQKDWELKESVAGINRMIASRREHLRHMAVFLEDPFNCDVVFHYSTVYRRGPELRAEIDRLVLIRLDLWRIIRKNY